MRQRAPTCELWCSRSGRLHLKTPAYSWLRMCRIMSRRKSLRHMAFRNLRRTDRLSGCIGAMFLSQPPDDRQAGRAVALAVARGPRPSTRRAPSAGVRCEHRRSRSPSGRGRSARSARRPAARRAGSSACRRSPSRGRDAAPRPPCRRPRVSRLSRGQSGRSSSQPMSWQTVAARFSTRPDFSRLGLAERLRSAHAGEVRLRYFGPGGQGTGAGRS